MKVQGTIIVLPKEERGASMATGKEWRKRFVIIETSEQYPKKICFALWNENIDKCAQQLEMGRQITAHVDIESREYNGRWYTEARAWRVDGQGVAIPNVFGSWRSTSMTPLASTPFRRNMACHRVVFTLGFVNLGYQIKSKRLL